MKYLLSVFLLVSFIHKVYGVLSFQVWARETGEAWRLTCNSTIDIQEVIQTVSVHEPASANDPEFKACYCLMYPTHGSSWNEHSKIWLNKIFLDHVPHGRNLRLEFAEADFNKSEFNALQFRYVFDETGIHKLKILTKDGEISYSLSPAKIFYFDLGRTNTSFSCDIHNFTIPDSIIPNTSAPGEDSSLQTLDYTEDYNGTTLPIAVLENERHTTTINHNIHPIQTGAVQRPTTTTTTTEVTTSKPKQSTTLLSTLTEERTSKQTQTSIVTPSGGILPEKEKTKSKSNKDEVAVGVVIPLILLLVIGGIVLFICLRKRRLLPRQTRNTIQPMTNGTNGHAIDHTNGHCKFETQISETSIQDSNIESKSLTMDDLRKLVPSYTPFVENNQNDLSKVPEKKHGTLFLGGNKQPGFSLI